MQLETWVDDNCLVIGEVEETDESFDHELGTEKRTGLSVKDISVIVYVSAIDHDITKALSDKWIEYYKQKLLDYAGPMFKDAV